MSSTVIKVEELGKHYRLGVIGTGTLSRDLNMWWAKLRGKPNPYAKINEDGSFEQDSHWALQDVSFEVPAGQVLGVIGKNGAGKSTLLKILSRVTTPSKGTVKIKGRVASLLEIGTGFHPELTGRENIFLNGAILGMTKLEIRRKFDEIVEFSGIGKYIDTPVKRYSSGMYVRLAFAVAAFLEPEILIVDEVLAVGDAEFQKKCVGKMQDVSEKEGRTVLFVSHNMASVKSLCTRALVLKRGQMDFLGDVQTGIERYLAKENVGGVMGEIPAIARTFNHGEAKYTSVMLLDANGAATDEAFYRSPLKFRLELEVQTPIKDALLDIMITSKEGIMISYATNTIDGAQAQRLPIGKQTVEVAVENNLLPGNYALVLGLHYSNGTTIDYVENVCDFTVLKISEDHAHDYQYAWKNGYVRNTSTWKF